MSIATPCPRAGRYPILHLDGFLLRGKSFAQPEDLLLVNSAAFVPILRQGNTIDLAGALDRVETFLHVTGEKWGRAVCLGPKVA